MSGEELIDWLEALAKKQRHERGCAFYLGTPDPQIAQCIAALRAHPLPEQPQEGDHIADAGKMVATHPNTDQGVTTEVTRPIIGIENRTAQEVFDIMCDRFRGANRLSSTAALEAEIASLKHRLESAEGLLADARLQLDYLHAKFVKTGTTAALLTRLDIFLQEQEKQPDSVAFLATTEADADNTPHSFDNAGYDTCRKCGNGESHSAHGAS